MPDFTSFDNFPYRLYIRDQHTVLYANKVALEFLDENDDGIIGKAFDEVFNDDSYIAHLKRIEKYFFVDENKSFVYVKEYNRYYNQAEIYQVIEYLETYNDQNVVVSILINLKNEVYLNQITQINEDLDYSVVSKRIIKKNGEIIQLTSLENSLIFLLANKRPEIVNYEEIFFSIDPLNKMNKVSLQSLIFRLNKKLDNIITCVSMQGYYIK